MKGLLDKIPASLICLDPNSLTQLNPDMAQSTQTWKFDNTDLMRSLDKEVTSKTKNKIKLNRNKKLQILDMIRKEKRENIRRFQKRKLKKKRSRFSNRASQQAAE